MSTIVNQAGAFYFRNDISIDFLLSLCRSVNRGIQFRRFAKILPLSKSELFQSC